MTRHGGSERAAALTVLGVAVLAVAVLAGCVAEPRYAASPSGSAIDLGGADASADLGVAGAGGGCAPAGVDGGACGRSQPALTCDVNNARDLGGVPLAPAGSVACGALFRGPPLSRLSAAGCREAARLGIRTILDLRTEGESRSNPDDACLQANVVAAPLPIPYGVSGAEYLADFDTKASMALIFKTFADPAAYPIYFHCTYGRDRTGVVAAATLLALGATRADVMSEYLLSQPAVGAFPDSLTAVLDEIDRRGGIASSLRAAGVTDADLTALRARATAP